MATHRQPTFHLPARFARSVVASGLLLGATVLTTGPAQARPDQDWQPDRAEAVTTRIDRMAERLDLTAAQQSELRGIMEDDRAQRDLQRQALRERINAVLTDAQKAKRDADMAQRMDRRLERMTDQLDLSEDQVARIKAVFDEQRTRPDMDRRETRERIAAILTDEQRATRRQGAMRDGPQQPGWRPNADRD